MGAYRQALQQLRPTSKISFSSDVENYDTLVWKDPTCQPPTREEVEARVVELQPAWDQWAIDRRASYPTIEEQLDMLWHTVNSGQHILPGCAWFETIKRIKQSTPKPE